MPDVSLSMLHYLVSPLVRLLHVNAMGCNAVFSGALSPGNHKMSLACRSPASSPTPGTYFFQVQGFFFIVELYAYMTLDDGLHFFIWPIVHALQCPVCPWGCKSSKRFTYLCSVWQVCLNSLKCLGIITFLFLLIKGGHVSRHMLFGRV